MYRYLCVLILVGAVVCFSRTGQAKGLPGGVLIPMMEKAG